jgi:hypothetical protein
MKSIEGLADPSAVAALLGKGGADIPVCLDWLGVALL